MFRGLAPGSAAAAEGRGATTPRRAMSQVPPPRSGVPERAGVAQQQQEVQEALTCPLLSCHRVPKVPLAPLALLVLVVLL